MAIKPDLIPGRVVHWLICVAVIGALLGCTPKLPTGMSAEDLQTCDDNAREDEELDASYQSFIDTHPYLASTGDVDLWAPLTGSILPYGEPVVIKFDQPPANSGVLYRNYRVIVTSINGSNLIYVGDQYAVVSMASFNIQVTWTPPGSGKYIIHVYLRNIETVEELGDNTAEMGNQLKLTFYQMEDFEIHSGPFSVAHVCVQIDVPKAGEIVPPQAGTVVPLANITISPPTATRTATHQATFTITPSTTPSPTSTPTLTFTPKPPTRIPPTPTLTLMPPTQAANCGAYLDKPTCERDLACQWEITSPTGGGGVCKNKT